MPLSWNEIKDRALHFSKEWKGTNDERSHAQSFWNEFFEVFGLTRKRVATFELAVKKHGGDQGFIDLFWPGQLLIEHKSRDKSLDRAFSQATDYFSGIKDRDLPNRVLVCDFERFRLYDLEQNCVAAEFLLKDLHKNVGHFAFIAGYQTRHTFEKEDSASIEAAERLGKVHDQLNAAGYQGHSLEVLLVRLLFCLFGDDTGIFERGQFREFVELRTAEDGSDLGAQLAHLFQVLNTPSDKRQKNLDEQLAAFTYVNGRLFEENLPLAAFDRKMREALLECAALDWSRISPAIFGSLFQSIMDKKARRNLGAHYTRESNILKALRPLFLDDLCAEFSAARKTPKKLVEFHRKLAAIRVLDPACGCGNFLVIAYRELRLLELDVLRDLYRQDKNLPLGVEAVIFVDVDQFYGIEIEEWPAQIAQVALWLTDHQMNMVVSEQFGQYFARLPLRKAPTVIHGNALQREWADVIAPDRLSYIVGNPPFVGAMVMSDEQRDDIALVFHGIKGAGVLDYVAAWYIKALRYMEQEKARGRIKCAFVSTSSITQGEQVGLLWRLLLPAKAQISFAHRTFRWSNEAKGVAAVHCVIIGFSLSEPTSRTIYEYENIDAEPHPVAAKNINPYLVDAPNVLLENRSDPLCAAPEMRFGSMPRDGGHLVLTPEERAELIAAEPEAAQFIRHYVGAEEFLNGGERYCLWLLNADPRAVRSVREITRRLDQVREYRLASKAASTRKAAATPGVFVQLAQPVTNYLLVPGVTSERRRYIPMGFMPPEVIASNLVFVVPNAEPWHFGVMSSAMHMAWVRYTCGRLESRYRYSKDIVYNNFPWPEPDDGQKVAIETAAQSVLDTRAKFPDATLADLYDPLTMPTELLRAHQALDKIVDATYGKPRGFKSEAERVAFLFGLYLRLASPIAADMGAPTAKPPTKRAKPAKRSAKKRKA
jgi:hypothetical protein